MPRSARPPVPRPPPRRPSASRERRSDQPPGVAPVGQEHSGDGPIAHEPEVLFDLIGAPRLRDHHCTSAASQTPASASAWRACCRTRSPCAADAANPATSSRRLAALRPSPQREIDAERLRRSVTNGATPNDVVYATRLPFDPGSPRDCGVLRGGALEPGALASFRKMRRQKQKLIQQLNYLRRSAEGLSLSGGASIVDLGLLKLSITFRFGVDFGPKTTKATLSDRPRSSSYAARQLASHTSGRGLGPHRTCARR